MPSTSRSGNKTKTGIRRRRPARPVAVPSPQTDGTALHFEHGFVVRFQRTLRIPDDGKTWPLPPGLGSFPIRAIDPHNPRVPSHMRERGGFLIPMYQREALWISFGGFNVSAVQVAIGGINAVSGRRWRPGLTARPQNYIVGPDQPWLDGINAGKGFIRQFVAMPLGQGYTVEEQITGKATSGGMQIRVAPLKPRIAARTFRGLNVLMGCAKEAMGIGAGGRMKQQVDRDTYGIGAWDMARAAEAFIHIVNSEQWTAITGEPLPPTPIDAATYTGSGLPWFDLYRDDTPAVSPSRKLGKIKSVGAIDKKKGRKPSGDVGVSIPGNQVLTIDTKGWPKK